MGANVLKVAYYSFPKKKIKVLESVKLKQQEVSEEVLVTAIDVKCNFTEQINANQGKMLNIVTELLEGGLETRHFKGFFLENQPYKPTSKFQITRHITIQIVTSSLTVVIACNTLMKKDSAFRNIGFFQYTHSPLYQPCSF